MNFLYQPLWLLKSLVLWSLAFVAIGDPVNWSVYPLEEAAKLKSGRGYLLIDLDIDSTATSMHFVRLKSEQTQTYLTPEQKFKHISKEIKFDFSDFEDGLYTRTLEAGVYQITRVNVPYFDFPFWMDTDKKRRWRFNIEADKLNYIGKLHVSGERKTNSVDVRLLNRFATDLEKLKSDLQRFPFDVPLVMSQGVQDEFDLFLTETN